MKVRTIAACSVVGALMTGIAFSSAVAQTATAPREVIFTADRIGLADAKKSFSIHLHIAFSQNSGAKIYADLARDGMARWVQANPDWAVETRIFSNSVASLPGLLEEARSGRAADCANIVPEYFQTFKRAGRLKPLTPYFSKEEIDDFFPFVRQTASLDNELHAFWFYTDARVLYRRTDLVPTAPATWDDLKKSALAAKTADAKVDGFLFNGGRWAGTWADLIAFYGMQGGEWANANGEPVFGDGRNREFLAKVLTYLKDLVDSGASPRRVTTTTSYSDFITAAKTGAVAMFIATDSQMAQLKEVLPADQFKQWATSPLPGMVPGQTSTTAGGWSFGVLTDDRERAAKCMDFVKTVYGPEFVANAGLLPPRQSSFASMPVYQAPQYRALADALKSGRPQPALPVTPAMSAAFQVMVGEVLSGAAPVDAALTTMVNTVQAAYKRLQ